MVTHKIVQPYPPFEYGSSVRVRVTPNPYKFTEGSVYGFNEIDDLEIAKKRGVALGTVYLLVEDGTGAEFEVPADDLEVI
jgi:hypothetical protein